MIHITAPKSTASAAYPLVGLYAFAKIESVDGTSVILSKNITTENGYDFTLNSSLLSTYYVQAITVPCYDSLTVSGSVTPTTWSTTTGGGIVALRTTGDCTVNDSILTHGKGAVRYDLHQMTNSKLIDRFLCSQGGGVFISCGGTLTIPSTARLGASWSGTGEGSHGATGYGGKGGGGSSGGVGAGGGGANSQGRAGGNVGSNGQDGISSSKGGSGGGGLGGLGGASYDTYGRAGGNGGDIRQTSIGINGELGGYSNSYPNVYCGGGGGGAVGGNGGAGGRDQNHSTSGAGGKAGASIILIAKALNANAAALSTGGAAGEHYTSNSYAASGGGAGTGFCYIACKEQVN